MVSLSCHPVRLDNGPCGFQDGIPNFGNNEHSHERSRRMKRIAMFTMVMVLAICPLAEAQVVINEVAWMGTSNTADEWIELYNHSGAPVDLEGWSIIDDGGTQTYVITGCVPDCTIAADGYFLIEDREEATDVTANLIVGLSLGNTGDSLELFDGGASSIDLVDCSEGWYAGDNTNDLTMERLIPLAAGHIPLNWGDNDPAIAQNGIDANGTPINGTPGQPNSLLGATIPGPTIVNLHVVDATSLDVTFSSEVEQFTAEEAVNYTLNAGGGDVQPGAATRDATDFTVVHLTGLSGIPADALTTVTATGVRDIWAAGEPSDTSADTLFGILPIATVRTDADENGIPDIVDSMPDTFVTVIGVVTSVQDLHYEDAIIQDDTAGLTINDRAVSDPLLRGDEIRVSGTIFSYHNKDSMENGRAVVLSQGKTVLPFMISLAELAADPEPYESMLLGLTGVSLTTGTWPSTEENTPLVATDDGGTTSYVLFIDRDTDCWQNTEPTWPASILVIAGQFDDEYQVAPRGIADFNPAEWPPEGSQRNCYTGPDGTVGVGICHYGTETYTGGAWSGNCVGEQTPESTDDDCDGVDENCSGVADEEADLTLATQCGSCDNDCTTLPNATNGACDTSAAPVCTFDCVAGFGDCAADPGCETALGTVDNCSACGDACVFDNAAASTCESAAAGCNMVCDDGYGDCSGGVVDGCETPLYTDANCSACGDDCSFAFANATGTCNGGTHVCDFVACLDNFGDCNTNTSDGCEIALTSVDHCGACDISCTDPEVCIDDGNGYECSSTCHDDDDDGFADDTCGGEDCNDDDNQVFPGAPELCDTVDNDCDDATDEDYTTLGNACDSPNDPDLCENGTFVCNATLDGVTCDGDEATPEACSGEDDDCDGQTDEDWPELGQACDGPDADSCADGVLVCNTAGNGTTCSETGAGKEEFCNGDDDDCDGQTDEDFGTYTCGKGVCEVTVDVCVNGQMQECIRSEDDPAYEASAELTCDDGLDNDCDGITDMQDLDCTQGDGDGGCGCTSSAQSRPALFGLVFMGLVMVLRRRRK
jgi:MYXO-CTERM domain-containing protein